MREYLRRVLAPVLAETDLAGLGGVLVPKVLVPLHPAVIEGIAVGAVVVVNPSQVLGQMNHPV